MMNKTFFTTALVLMFVFLPFAAFAQVEVGKRINLTAVPQNPVPGETVNVSVSSSEVNVDLATIEWFVDGKSTKKGMGLKTFSFAAGANGKTNTVSVRVAPQTGSAIESSMTFAPAELDLIWEAENAYVPPFYKGKTLPIKQGAVKVVAMPNVRGTGGAMIKPSLFAYTWQKDGQNMPGKSGFGQSSLQYINQMLEDSNRVDVSASNGAKKVSRGIVISYFEPDLVFYEADSVTGVQYQRALVSGFQPKFANATVALEPYYLPQDWKTSSMTTLDWTLGGQKANPRERGLFAFNIVKGSGSSTISAAYNETNKLFRKFSKSLTVTPN